MIGRSVQFSPSQPDLHFHRTQDSWRKVEERADTDQKDGQSKNGIEMHESESAQHCRVLAQT